MSLSFIIKQLNDILNELTGLLIYEIIRIS